MSEPDDRDTVERVAARLRASEHVDSTFDARLMSSARKAVAHGDVPWRRLHAVPLRRRSMADWLTRPRRIRVSPLVGLAVAAGFAAIAVGTTLVLTNRSRPTPSVAVAPAGQELVRFVVVIPTAHRVTVVGDFNGWNPASTSLAQDAAGRVWTVSMSLPAGTYQYAFVVDGKTWMADPTASIRLEDEFGTPSSVLTVVGKRT
jgi:hypothetical protein